MSSWGTIDGTTVIWHGTGKTATSMSNAYVSVDKDISLKSFKVSGSGGNYTNMNLIFDGTTLSQTSSTPFEYNNTPKDLDGDGVDEATTNYSMGFYYKAKETVVDGETTYSTGTANFTNSNVKFDLYSKDINSNGELIGNYGRVVSFGKGITANFTKDLTVSGRNPDLKVSDSLFDIAGNVNVVGTLTLTDTNVDISGTLATDMIKLNNATINYTGNIVRGEGSNRAQIDAISGVSNIVVGKNSKKFEDSRIRVESGATLNLDLTACTTQPRLCNATTYISGTLNITSALGAHSPSTYIKNPTTVDGGTITETGNVSAFMLCVVSAKLSLQNGALLKTTNGWASLGENGNIEVDATSKIDSKKIVFTASKTDLIDPTGNIYFSSANNLVQKTGLYVKSSSLTQHNHMKVHLTNDGGVYNFGNIELLRKASITIDLNGASMSMDKLMILDGKHNGGVVGELIFEDFVNGLVKVGIDESILNADGTLVPSASNVSLAIKAYDVNGNLLTGDWSINNGYLWNSALAVPEPAEWAMILGGIALGLAIYRRRK